MPKLHAKEAKCFANILTEMMTLAALSRTKCRAASFPRPILAPVTIMVLPVQSWSGYGSVSHISFTVSNILKGLKLIKETGKGINVRGISQVVG